jgi:RsiW-degrading membrane proteinase PrsW (M82 family)
MESFRLALLIGAAVMLGLVTVGLYPAALAAAAVVVPILVTIYLHDVDVYEDEPVRVLALTILGGALAGLVLSLLEGALDARGQAQGAGLDVTGLAIDDVVLPIVALAAILAGPLLLLRYPKFNDVLDGATFGASSAIGFFGASTLLAALQLTESGATPAGATLPRLLVVAEVGLLVPLIGAGAVGAAAGTLWLATRSSLRDARPLGLLGQPVIAMILGATFLVLAALARDTLGEPAGFAVLLGLAAVALAWLRLLIHVGLLDESAERPIGPDITCANCGRSTPRHTFCGRCGVSLRALPKGTRRGGDRPAVGGEA